MNEGRTFFSTPYTPESVTRLAKSTNPFERWEAANALVDMDSKTAEAIFELLKLDEDKLVQEALKRQFTRFSEGDSSPKGKKQQEKSGLFLEAYSEPLGPLKIERLSSLAISSARRSFQAGSMSGKNERTFPQANSIQTILAMFDQLITYRAIHGGKLGLVDRQVVYYRDALLYIGLVEEQIGGVFVPSNKIVNLKTSYQRLDFVLRSFLGIPAVSAAYLGMLGLKDSTKRSPPHDFQAYLEYFASIDDSRGLSSSTLIRRAQTGLSWASQIIRRLGLKISRPEAWKTANT